MSEKNSINKLIDKIVDKIISLFRDFAELLSTKKGENIIRIIFHFFLILIFIWLLKLPFSFVESIGKMFIKVFPFGLDYVFGTVLTIIIRFAYLIVAAIVLYIMMKRLVEDESYNVETKKKSHHTKKETMNYASLMFKPFYILTKIIVIIVLIPFILSLICLSFIFGMLFCFLFEGIYLVSLFFIVGGAILIVSSIVGFLYHITFTKKGEE